MTLHNYGKKNEYGGNHFLTTRVRSNCDISFAKMEGKNKGATTFIAMTLIKTTTSTTLIIITVEHNDIQPKDP